MTTNQRIIIAGGGTVGLQTAALLDDRGHDVVIVESRPDRCDRLSDEYVGTVIEGDATRPSILQQAQPERADVIAALTDDEPANFAICMAAQRLTEIRTVMRLESTPDARYTEFVDAVVTPKLLGARAAANEIVGPGVRTIEDIAGAVEVVEVEVAEGAPVAGKTLAEVRLPRGSLIVVDYQGDRIGGPETVLEPGHRYVLAVESDVVGEVMNLMRG